MWWWWHVSPIFYASWPVSIPTFQISTIVQTTFQRGCGYFNFQTKNFGPPPTASTEFNFQNPKSHWHPKTRSYLLDQWQKMRKGHSRQRFWTRCLHNPSLIQTIINNRLSSHSRRSQFYRLAWSLTSLSSIFPGHIIIESKELIIIFSCALPGLYKSLDCCTTTPRTWTSVPVIWIFIRCVTLLAAYFFFMFTFWWSHSIYSFHFPRVQVPEATCGLHN